LIANPIPANFAFLKSEIDTVIDEAVKAAAELGIQGHANTPFILARIKEHTKGRSVQVNRALIESNVKFAASIALSLERLRKDNSNENSEDQPDAQHRIAQNEPRIDRTSSTSIEQNLAKYNVNKPSAAPVSTGFCISIFQERRICVDLQYSEYQSTEYYSLRICGCRCCM
jgi:hypothetical protein